MGRNCLQILIAKEQQQASGGAFGCLPIFHARHARAIQPEVLGQLLLCPSEALAESLYVERFDHDWNVHNAHF